MELQNVFLELPSDFVDLQSVSEVPERSKFALNLHLGASNLLHGALNLICGTYLELKDAALKLQRSFA